MKVRLAVLALVATVVVGVGSSNAARTATLTLTLGESSASAYASGTELFYVGSGFDFTVTASGGTPSYAFPTVPGFDPPSVSADTATYNHTGTPTEGTYQVTDSAVSVNNGTFKLWLDNTPPTGQTVALSGGPNYTTNFVPLVLGNGSDTRDGTNAGAGVDSTSGQVQRASAPLSGGSCGTFGGYTTVALTGGADTTVTSGNCYRYQYSVKDNVGNLSAPSAASEDAKVSSTVATVAIVTPTKVSGTTDQFWTAATKTLWYRPTATGSFKINATATDAASGISKVTFPDLSAVSGWTGAGGDVTGTSPYASPTTYSWTAGATAPGAQKVIATSNSALTAFDTVTISADSTPPTGQSVSLTGGPWFATSVPLTLVAGTDAGSGVDTTKSVVERASATLTNGLCGTFGTFAAVTLSGNSDNTVATGNCYRYQVKATDNVGNVSTASTPSADAKTDSTPPSTPSLFFSGFSNTAATSSVVYFRPGGTGSFTVTAASADRESGIASYSFPAIPGFTAVGSGPHRTYASTHTGTTATGSLAITATNAAGASSGVASFSLVPDATPPTLTVRCNRGVCSKRPYAKAVTVTLTARDATSGVQTVRWTSDGTDPKVDHGYEYLRGIPVAGLTHLKIRAFDRAGNASPLVKLTVNSRAGRLTFGAPAAVALGAKARYLSVRVTSTRRANVKLTMVGTGMKKAAHWYFVLDSGTSIVRLRLPAGLKHPGNYRIFWSLRSGTQSTSRSTTLRLR